MIYEDNSKYKVEYIGEKFSKDLISYKIIFIGRYGVGKTSIIHKLMNKKFDKEYQPTMSIDIKNIQVKVNEEIMQINIWDSCGNDKFALNTPNLFKNVSISIHNILKEYSLESIIFLIGNKSDLEEEREVKIEEGEEFKNNYKDEIN